MTTLYDKTGAAFSLDHEHDGTAYVRPMVKVVYQSGYGDDIHESEDYEPAQYLVAMDKAELFDAPPVALIDDEVAAKKDELDALKTEARKSLNALGTEEIQAKARLRDVQHQLETWMEKHRVMMDLGKILDGEVLYPLTVRKNSYHRGREIPRIPEMRSAKYLAVHSGDWTKGKPWVCKQYAEDTYGSPFQFFYTEEERTAAIQSEFDATCEEFRKSPNFDTTSHTTGTTLHYGTLMEWVKTHPALIIPDDIKAMKAENDAQLVAQRKAQLAAELAEIEARGEQS